MTDLAYGALVIAALALMLFLLGLMTGRAAPRWFSDGLGVLTIVGLLLYIRYLWDNILLAKLLPYSNLIVLGNWLPLGAGLLGGLAWRRIPGGAPKKGLYVAALLGASAFALALPLRGRPPQCRDVWYNRVCIQTSDLTCSPACAATLLAYHGISATESEMARLCLTRRGTNWMGVYRGLMLKTRTEPFDVEVFDCDAEQLRRLVKDGPAILNVGLPDGAEADPVYTDRYGWRPGRGHSVVLFDYRSDPRGGGHYFVGDPSIETGVEVWSEQDMRILFRGRGLQLVTTMGK